MCQQNITITEVWWRLRQALTACAEHCSTATRNLQKQETFQRKFIIVLFVAYPGISEAADNEFFACGGMTMCVIL
jgi:hypothetical protein